MSEVGETLNAPVEPPANDKLLGTAAIAIEVAMVLLLVAGLIGALAFELGDEVEGWKVRAKLMSLSGQGLYGFTGVGGGVLVAVALLVALGLARVGADRGVRPALISGIGTVAVAISLWLALLVAVAIYVDVTEIDQADLAAATALGDAATLVMLAVSGWWGLTMAGPRRR